MGQSEAYNEAVAALRRARVAIDNAAVATNALEAERRALELNSGALWPDPNAGAGTVLSVPAGESLAAWMEGVGADIAPGPVVFHIAAGAHAPLVLDAPWAARLFRGRTVRIVGRGTATEIQVTANGSSVVLGRGMGDIEGYQVEFWSLVMRGDVRRVAGIGKGAVRFMDATVKSREVDAHGD